MFYGWHSSVIITEFPVLKLGGLENMEDWFISSFTRYWMRSLHTRSIVTIIKSYTPQLTVHGVKYNCTKFRITFKHIYKITKYARSD